MGISYRRLTQTEGLSYREIRLESLGLCPDEFGSSYEEQSRVLKLNFEKALEEPVDEQFVIGAFDGDCLMGVCGFISYAGMGIEESKTNSTGTIVQVYVRPAFGSRKTGLGLVRAVVWEALRIERIRRII